MKLYHLLLLLTFPLLWSSCEIFGIDNIPYPDELPSITMEGKNKIGCLLNGEVWVNCGGNLEKSSISGNFSETSNIFQILSNRDCGEFDDSFIFSANVTNGVGKYAFRRAVYSKRGSECHSAWNPYGLLENADNWVEILYLDTEEHIVSGTFQCTLVHPDCGDTLYITDGRFDYQWAV